MKYYLRRFNSVSNPQNIENVLRSSFVAKQLGFSYGENTNKKLAKETLEYVQSCKALYEVIYNGEVIGFVGFVRAGSAVRAMLIKEGVFGDDPYLASNLADSSLETTFALSEKHIGKGIGTQVVKAAIEKAIRQCRCPCVVALYAVFAEDGENLRSKNLLHRLNFTPFATFSKVGTPSGDNPAAVANYYLDPELEKIIEFRKAYAKAGMERFKD